MALTLALAACSSDGTRAPTTSSDGNEGSSTLSSSGGAASSSDPADTNAPQGPCGMEFQVCCAEGMACGSGMGLTCSDSACVSCDHVPSSQPACTNVASLGTATASLVVSGGSEDHRPELTIDGSACNYYNSGNFPSDEASGLTETWLAIDLGEKRTLNAMTLWLSMTPAGMVNLRLEYGEDGTNWQQEFSGTRDMSGTEPWLYDFGDPKVARFFRVVFLASPSWVGVRELQLFDCSGGEGDAGSG